MSWIDRGWQVFAAEPAVDLWLRAAGPAALACSTDAAQRRRWLRHDGTWFVGVDALPNGTDGSLAGGPPLAGAALETAFETAGRLPLHRGQVSVTWPGYPGRDAGESEAAHRFRVSRDAAHLDGLLPVGPKRRRFLKEMHAFILGIAVTGAGKEAAPLVVWEGSQRIIRDTFAKALGNSPPEAWSEIDVTDIYADARRRVFESCIRRTVPLKRGEAVLVHRHTIHGVAPWAAGAHAPPEGRAIIYFRPEFATAANWLNRP